MDLTKQELETINYWIPSSNLKNRVQKELDRIAAHEAKEFAKSQEKKRLDEENYCIFDISWQGRCKRKAWAGADVQMCKEHSEEKCRVCGEQAYLSCSAFSGSFVCGSSVCESHRIHQSDDSHRTTRERVDEIRRKMNWEASDV